MAIDRAAARLSGGEAAETPARTPVPAVEVLWRPGCGFCGALRRGLRRAGVDTVEHDIWASPAAAARVRAVTGGDETVPTVIVGTQSLVNPSVSRVLRALQDEYPEHEQPAAAERSGGVRVPGGSAGPWWTAAVALTWLALALWRPSTTWHLAPLLLAAAWPWVVGQDQSPGDRSGRRRVLAAGVAGLTAAVLGTAALATSGLLRGPTWTGSGSPVVEALVLAVAGSLVATLAGLARTVRRAATVSARLGTRSFAASDDVVLVEGNAYFPLDSVPDGVLQPSSTTSVCPWKGVASYYDVHVDDQVIPDGAWTYRHPLPLARRVKGRVAFRNGIEVDRD